MRNKLFKSFESGLNWLFRESAVFKNLSDGFKWRSPSGRSSLQQSGQRVWLFHYCAEDDRCSPACLRPLLPTPSKSSTNENWVKFCLLVLSNSQCGAARLRKRCCLWSNNTGSTETEELGFYSSPVHSREHLLAIDVFLLGYCYCTFNAETLWDLCWKGIRISDDPDAIMTSTSSARHSFYVHPAQIHRNDEPATSHSQSKGSNSHGNSARSPLLKAEIVMNAGSLVPSVPAHSWRLSLIGEGWAPVT